MQRNIQISLMIKILNNAFKQELNKEIAPLDLSSSQAHVLGYLSHNQDKTIFQKNIEEQFNLKHPTVTGILQRLEEKGFIKQIPLETDHRYKQIILTEKSRILHDRITELSLVTVNKFLAGMSVDEVNTLKLLLNKMLANVDLKQAIF